MELVASCHSPDFKTLKALTKVNPSCLLGVQAAFCHSYPTLAGEELQAPTSVCPTIPFYPIFHFAWWLLHAASSSWEESTAPSCCCSAPPWTGAPGEPIPSVQYFTHRWHSRERALTGQHWNWEAPAPTEPCRAPCLVL